jgi:hypothetical protein
MLLKAAGVLKLTSFCLNIILNAANVVTKEASKQLTAT